MAEIKQESVCPVCISNKHKQQIYKNNGEIWRQCDTCDSVYLLNKDIFTPVQTIGGNNEQDRNTEEANNIRIERIRKAGANTLFDFGCGSGLLVEQAKKLGIKARGYDPLADNRVADKIDTSDDSMVLCCSMVEVIEHLELPRREIDNIVTKYEPDIFYVETSFADNLGNLSFSEYVSSSIGHYTIFSEKGCDQLFKQFGYELKSRINNNTRIYCNKKKVLPKL